MNGKKPGREIYHPLHAASIRNFESTKKPGRTRAFFYLKTNTGSDNETLVCYVAVRAEFNAVIISI